MLINLRGTSGSGKSTIIRQVMELYDTKNAVRLKGDERKQPIGYSLSKKMAKGNDKLLAVLGHYETNCGGCDTITSMDKIYEQVRAAADTSYDVLFEGLLLSAEVNRTLALHTDGYPLLVIGLDTPLELCLSSVNGRRQGTFDKRLEAALAENAARLERGLKTKPLPEPRGDVKPKNTESKYKATVSTMKRLADNGVATEWHDRDGALARIREVLGI